MKWLGTMIVALAAAVCLGEADVNRFMTYSYGFSESETVKQAVTAIVGGTGDVIMDPVNNRVLVVAPAAKQAQVAEAMKLLNKPPKNVRIEVRFSGAARQHTAGISVGGNGGLVRTERGSSTFFKIQPTVRNETTTTSETEVQSLLVASGRAGALQVGESVPYVEWFTEYGFAGGYLQQRVSWQKVGSYLVVEPVVVGDGPLIRVRLTPELRGLVDNNPYQVRFTKVATEVVVSDGQSFSIGGLDKDSSFYSKFLVGFDRSGNTARLDITLSPHILPATGP